MSTFTNSQQCDFDSTEFHPLESLPFDTYMPPLTDPNQLPRYINISKHFSLQMPINSSTIITHVPIIVNLSYVNRLFMYQTIKS